MAANTILIVEDDGILCADMEDMLTAEGYEVMGVLPSGEAALELVKKERHPDIIIMDINLAGELDGISTVEQIKTVADIPVIYLTAYADDILLRRARETAPHAFLVKPVQDLELIATIEIALHRHSLEKKLRQTEAILRQSEEKHRLLFETMAQGVIYQASDGAIISANPAAERILGLSFEQMEGKPSMDPRWQMIKEDGTAVPGTEHPAMIALSTGQKVGPVTRGIYHPDKHDHVWLNITAIPLFQPGETKPFQAYATFEDITERKRRKEELRNEKSMQQLLIKLATGFINIPSDKVDKALNEMLEAVGRFSNMDRVFIFQHDYNKQIATNTHEWCADGITPQINNLQATPFSYLYDILEDHHAGKIVSIPSVAGLPPEHKMRDIFERQGIQSLVLLPLFIDGANMGFVGFDAVRELRRFSETEIKLLKILAEIIANTLARQQVEKELRIKSQAIAASIDPVAIADLFGTLTYINPAFLKLWGYEHEDQVLGRSVLEFHDDRQSATKVMGTLIKEDWYTGELKALKADGELRDLLLAASMVYDRDGTPLGMTASFLDITERKTAEEKLKKVLNEYETVFQGTQAAMFLVKVIDANTFRYVRNNQSHMQMTGISTEIITGKTPQELFGAAPGETVAANYKRCVEAADSISYEETLTLAGGTCIWHTSLTPVFEQNRISYLVGSALDISARKQAEAEARRVEVLQAMENERMRLARDLHDEMGMLLYAVKLELQLLISQLSGADSHLKVKLQNSINTMTDAIATVRQKSASLRSPDFDELDLSDVLVDMMEELNQKTDIKITLKLAAKLPYFSPDIDNTLYRCIQEALTNGVRHSGAANMTVELAWNGEEVNCTITDDGVGFDTSIIDDYSRNHLGLTGMEERVFLVRGRLDIKSAPGQGTKIGITIPLAKK